MERSKSMSDYIKREDAITKLEEWAVNIINPKFIVKEDAICALKNIPSADVVEVGKAYPREEFEKYGLSEWKGKHGQRWVMIERKQREEQEHE